MKINFLGDSITQGACASCNENNYVSVFAKETGWEARNYGIGGTRIAISKENIEYNENNFIDRVDSMNHDADYVVVFGGTNDYGHGNIPFGEFGDNTPYTFYGAVEYLINKLLKHYKKEQIIFLEPIYRSNENHEYGDGSKTVKCPSLETYREAIRAVTKKHNITCINLCHVLPNPDDLDTFTDGLHPNDKGHHILGVALANYFKGI